MLGREAKITGVIKRKGDTRAWVLIVEMDKEEDTKDLLEKDKESRRRWGIEIDEDLTLKERKLRWRLVEKAREERAKGKEVTMTSRKIWIERKEWNWSEGKQEWNEGAREEEE